MEYCTLLILCSILNRQFKKCCSELLEMARQNGQNALLTTSGLAQAGGEVQTLKGSAGFPPPRLRQAAIPL